MFSRLSVRGGKGFGASAVAVDAAAGDGGTIGEGEASALAGEASAVVLNGELGDCEKDRERLGDFDRGVVWYGGGTVAPPAGLGRLVGWEGRSCCDGGRQAARTELRKGVLRSVMELTAAARRTSWLNWGRNSRMTSNQVSRRETGSFRVRWSPRSKYAFAVADRDATEANASDNCCEKCAHSEKDRGAKKLNSAVSASVNVWLSMLAMSWGSLVRIASRVESSRPESPGRGTLRGANLPVGLAFPACVRSRGALCMCAGSERSIAALAEAPAAGAGVG